MSITLWGETGKRNSASSSQGKEWTPTFGWGPPSAIMVPPVGGNANDHMNSATNNGGTTKGNTRFLVIDNIKTIVMARMIIIWTLTYRMHFRRQHPTPSRVHKTLPEMRHNEERNSKVCTWKARGWLEKKTWEKEMNREYGIWPEKEAQKQKSRRRKVFLNLFIVF